MATLPLSIACGEPDRGAVAAMRGAYLSWQMSSTCMSV
jgi:hypothetical protein